LGFWGLGRGMGVNTLRARKTTPLLGEHIVGKRFPESCVGGPFAHRCLRGGTFPCVKEPAEKMGFSTVCGKIPELDILYRRGWGCNLGYLTQGLWDFFVSKVLGPPKGSTLGSVLEKYEFCVFFGVRTYQPEISVGNVVHGWVFRSVCLSPPCAGFHGWSWGDYLRIVSGVVFRGAFPGGPELSPARVLGFNFFDIFLC